MCVWIRTQKITNQPTNQRVIHSNNQSITQSINQQTEIIPEEIASLPLPPGTSYRCLSEESVRSLSPFFVYG
jgi:hypothetical protein